MRAGMHTHTHTSLPHPLLPRDFFPPESVLGSALRFSVGALFPTPASRVVLSASWERKIPHFFFFLMHQVLILAHRI